MFLKAGDTVELRSGKNFWGKDKSTAKVLSSTRDECFILVPGGSPGWVETKDIKFVEPSTREKSDLQVAVEKNLDIYPNDDPINHPPHYNRKGIECIQAISARITTSASRSSSLWLIGKDHINSIARSMPPRKASVSAVSFILL